MDKKNIAILMGGLSEERVISLKSAAFVEEHLSKSKYRSRVIILDEDRWYDRDSGEEVNRNDFSVQFGGEKISFDGVYLIIHGPPVEDGRIQGYFDLLGIPHTTCDTFTSALCFNKQATKHYLKPFGVPMAQSVLLKGGQLPDKEQLKEVGFPVFVKPNQHGSSFGISRADDGESLRTSCEFAYEFDEEILVESYLEGREFSCGVIQKEGEILALLPTEIISETEFFDYAAKYEHRSQEITPADISKAQSDQCRALSAKIYDLLNCRGMVRIDYILHGGIFTMLEVNTVPGLSPESIIPAQARAMGWSYEEFLDRVVEEMWK
nr:D-alanine--D-alanine ligase [Saprospiraceae bacterium]